MFSESLQDTFCADLFAEAGVSFGPGVVIASELTVVLSDTARFLFARRVDTDTVVANGAGDGVSTSFFPLRFGGDVDEAFVTVLFVTVVVFVVVAAVVLGVERVGMRLEGEGVVANVAVLVDVSSGAADRDLLLGLFGAMVVCSQM